MTTLSVISYIERINRVYRLIRMERTGSLDELAETNRTSTQQPTFEKAGSKAYVRERFGQPWQRPDGSYVGRHEPFGYVQTSIMYAGDWDEEGWPFRRHSDCSPFP